MDQLDRGGAVLLGDGGLVPAARPGARDAWFAARGRCRCDVLSERYRARAGGRKSPVPAIVGHRDGRGFAGDLHAVELVLSARWIFSNVIEFAGLEERISGIHGLA